MLFFSACLPLLVHQTSGADASTREQRPVVAQELKNVRASGKVMTALWTRRVDAYTLQLVFPIIRPARTTAASVDGVALGFPASPAVPARVKIWLINPDGSQVPSTYQSPAPKAEQLNCMRCISYEVSYSFSSNAAEKAVAAAVQINDEFFIDQLQPFAAATRAPALPAK